MELNAEQEQLESARSANFYGQHIEECYLSVFHRKESFTQLTQN